MIDQPELPRQRDPGHFWPFLVACALEAVVTVCVVYPVILLAVAFSLVATWLARL